MTSELPQGLTYISDFISDEEHKELLDVIDQQMWSEELRRRVQHYGFKYDYKKRNIDYSMYLGEMPNWLKAISHKLVDARILITAPDQVIINEYLVGQGIANHIDCEPCFGETIISLSLGSSCVMKFERNSKDKVELLLSPKSLLVLNDEARYNWTHGIPARQKDKFNGQVIPRDRRISLTFRNVIIKE